MEARAGFLRKLHERKVHLEWANSWIHQMERDSDENLPDTRSGLPVNCHSANSPRRFADETMVEGVALFWADQIHRPKV